MFRASVGVSTRSAVNVELTGEGESRANTASRLDSDAIAVTEDGPTDDTMVGVATVVVGIWSMSAGGGSAMPCGLVSPDDRAKVAAALWLPEVRLAAPVYW